MGEVIDLIEDSPMTTDTEKRQNVENDVTMPDVGTEESDQTDKQSKRRRRRRVRSKSKTNSVESDVALDPEQQNGDTVMQDSDVSNVKCPSTVIEDGIDGMNIDETDEEPGKSDLAETEDAQSAHTHTEASGSAVIVID